MLKNNRGVTITALVVTLIIMLILAAVTMTITINTSKTVDLKELVSNMELIRTSAQGYSDRYLDSDPSQLPGVHNSTVTNIMGTLIGTTTSGEGEAVEISEYWYQLDEAALKEMSIDIKLKDDEAYFIDYQSNEVAYVKSTIPVDGSYPGVTTTSGKIVYFYSQIKSLKADQVGN